MTRGRLPGGGGSSVVGKRETRLYEPEERLHSSPFTAPFCNFPSFVRPRGCKKRSRGGYLAGVVSVVCHEVPMDKGTSESSLLGVGSPLPSIPLHSIVSYCTVPYQTR
ncbi:NADH-ubiquinone oxidoreductase chain [Striga asiatica]|uniref:NADH-ubiquinone oxidoreductase chain n=1 Tax=Striga asiatica TaxID=4170 RepID=A0A5A7QML4_STRAF|nr:NADH-ubiquinone oxidoreductase chain [Striga asiatica]